MKKAFLLFALVVFTISCFSQEQDSTQLIYVRDSELFHGEGLIFPKDFYITTLRANKYSRFTPDTTDIYIAEGLFISQYNFVCENDSRISNHRTIKKVKKYFYYYNRQYYGYTKGEDKIIIIDLLNFKFLKKRHFKEIWGEFYFSGSGTFYEKNTRTVGVNLTTNTVFIP